MWNHRKRDRNYPNHGNRFQRFEAGFSALCFLIIGWRLKGNVSSNGGVSIIPAFSKGGRKKGKHLFIGSVSSGSIKSRQQEGGPV